MELVRYVGEEWSALYRDGLLVTYGDHYLVDEELESILKVERREGDDFLVGTNRKAASTLAEVEAYTVEAEERQAQADELRRQADELERQAKALREQAGKN